MAATKLSWYGITEFLWCLATLALVGFEGWFTHTTSTHTALNIVATVADLALTIVFYVAGMLVRETKKPRTWRQRLAFDHLLLTLKLTIPIFYAVDLLGEGKATRYNGAVSMVLLVVVILRPSFTNLADFFDVFVFDGNRPVDGRIVGPMTHKGNGTFEATLHSGVISTKSYRDWVDLYEGVKPIKGRIYVVPSNAVYAVCSSIMLTVGLMVVGGHVGYRNPEIDSAWFCFSFYLIPMAVYGLRWWPYDQWQRQRQLGRCQKIIEPTLVFILPMIGIWATMLLMLLVEDSTAEWIAYLPLLMPITIAPAALMLLLIVIGKAIGWICPATEQWRGCCRFWTSSFLVPTPLDVADAVRTRPLPGDELGFKITRADIMP